MEEVQVNETVQEVVQVDVQAEANKVAVMASAGYHLDKIYGRYGKIANAVAQIIRSTQRDANWSEEEVKAIWDRVEKEV